MALTNRAKAGIDLRECQMMVKKLSILDQETSSKIIKVSN
jgi:hypothetical protein